MVRSRNLIFGEHTHMITRKKTRYTVLTLNDLHKFLKSKQYILSFFWLSYEFTCQKSRSQTLPFSRNLILYLKQKHSYVILADIGSHFEYRPYFFLLKDEKFSSGIFIINRSYSTINNHKTSVIGENNVFWNSSRLQQGGCLKGP